MLDTKQLSEKVMKAWDEKDEASMRELLHPDYVCTDPMTTTRGIDNTIEKMREFKFESDLKIRNCICEGDMVVIEGDWLVSAPMKAEVPLSTTMRFENGRLKEKYIYFDTAKLAQA